MARKSKNRRGVHSGQAEQTDYKADQLQLGPELLCLVQVELPPTTKSLDLRRGCASAGMPAEPQPVC